MIRKSMPSGLTRWVAPGFPKRSCSSKDLERDTANPKPSRSKARPGKAWPQVTRRMIAGFPEKDTRQAEPKALPGSTKPGWCLCGAAVESASLTEKPKIIGHHGLDRIGNDAEAFQGAALRMRVGRNHIVDLEHIDLVGRQWRVGQVLQDGRLQLHQPKRHRHQQASALDGGQDELHQFLEGVDLGASELVGR